MNEKTRHKISLLTPAFREEVVIGRTLKHLVEDVEYPDYEIIVGVDGEYDDTLRIASEYRDKHPGMISIHCEKERIGVSAMMRILISKASGDIIIKFDSDMCFGNPRKALHWISRYFQDPEIGALYYCGEYEFRNEAFQFMDPAFIAPMRAERYKSISSRAENFVSVLVYQYRKLFFPVTRKTWLPIDTHCFRKDLVEGLDDGMIHDDIAFAESVLEKGFRIELAPDIIVFTPGGQPYDVKGLWDQKNKGNAGWAQMRRSGRFRVNRYFFGVFLTFLKNVHRAPPKDIAAFVFWCAVFIPNYLLSFFRRHGSPAGVWKRYKRVVRS